jgi:hypothetical protein
VSRFFVSRLLNKRPSYPVSPMPRPAAKGFKEYASRRYILLIHIRKNKFQLSCCSGSYPPIAVTYQTAARECSGMVKDQVQIIRLEAPNSPKVGIIKTSQESKNTLNERLMGPQIRGYDELATIL